MASEPGRIYIPMEESAVRLGWQTKHDRARGTVRINRTSMAAGSLRMLLDGSVLVALPDLERVGATVFRDERSGQYHVMNGSRGFAVQVGRKRVEIDLETQRLRAWQGSRLVLESRVSTGRGGSTPTGNFRAGPYKARQHFSSLYDNAPMPWSVQVHGHVFIHGFTVVPDYPASHGCIRMPLDEGNPARFFYEWVDSGTPIRILRTEVTSTSNSPGRMNETITANR